MKRKACKKCKIFVEGDECAQCKTSQFALNWKGRITILDHEKSEIAQAIGLSVDGEYAIKVN
ncbi:MAG: DNA-directed RNA polymerase subunit E'' [Candidatus Aenigmarchaeota archaeon]|nr:DNA-directed RNA polymerase subunit E'' [Candidatus Aenigmarchaeota archaeon]